MFESLYRTVVPVIVFMLAWAILKRWAELHSVRWWPYFVFFVVGYIVSEIAFTLWP